jgi:fatty-acyl-CoA synthase
MAGPMPGTVLEAMAALADVADRGFTFVDERGREVFASFGEIVAEARRRAAALRGLGLAPGARLALIVPEHRDFVVALLAAMAAGLVPVPIYPPLSLAKLENWLETTTGILRVSGAAAIVSVDEVCALLWSAAARLGARVVPLDHLAAHAGGVLSGPDLHADVNVDADDVAFLQFTSGSTAAPRGVMVSHRNIAESCAGIGDELLDSAAHDKGVSWLPLYHDMGLIGFVFAPLFRARPAVLLATLGFLKRPALWFELIHRHRATVTFAPNFGYALAARRITAEEIARWDLSCLRVAGCGGEPVAANTLRSFSERFAPARLRPEALLPCYGMAEATLVVTYSRAGAVWRRDVVDADRLQNRAEAVRVDDGARHVELVGCGAPLGGHAVRVVDAAGNALPERAIGEIEFRGPSLTRGYFGDPEATSAAFRGGALRTGDLGYLADGQLFVTGRKKDLIIVHGRNYAPQTIEWSVGAVADVRRGNVVAFARPNQRGTEEVVVVCEARTTDRAGLARAIRARVADDVGLTVGDVVILPAGFLPKTSSGKVQRARTRTLYLDGELQRIAASKPPAGVGRLLLLARLRVRSVAGRIQYLRRRAGWSRPEAQS